MATSPLFSNQIAHPSRKVVLARQRDSDHVWNSPQDRFESVMFSLYVNGFAFSTLDGREVGKVARLRKYVLCWGSKPPSAVNIV